MLGVGAASSGERVEPHWWERVRFPFLCAQQRVAAGDPFVVFTPRMQLLPLPPAPAAAAVPAAPPAPPTASPSPAQGLSLGGNAGDRDAATPAAISPTPAIAPPQLTRTALLAHAVAPAGEEPPAAEHPPPAQPDGTAPPPPPPAALPQPDKSALGLRRRLAAAPADADAAPAETVPERPPALLAAVAADAAAPQQLWPEWDASSSSGGWSPRHLAAMARVLWFGFASPDAERAFRAHAAAAAAPLARLWSGMVLVMIVLAGARSLVAGEGAAELWALLLWVAPYAPLLWASSRASRHEHIQVSAPRSRSLPFPPRPFLSVPPVFPSCRLALCTQGVVFVPRAAGRGNERRAPCPPSCCPPLAPASQACFLACALARAASQALVGLGLLALPASMVLVVQNRLEVITEPCLYTLVEQLHARHAAAKAPLYLASLALLYRCGAAISPPSQLWEGKDRTPGWGRAMTPGLVQLLACSVALARAQGLSQRRPLALFTHVRLLAPVRARARLPVVPQARGRGAGAGGGLRRGAAVLVHGAASGGGRPPGLRAAAAAAAADARPGARRLRRRRRRWPLGRAGGVPRRGVGGRVADVAGGCSEGRRQQGVTGCRSGCRGGSAGGEGACGAASCGAGARESPRAGSGWFLGRAAPRSTPDFVLLEAPHESPGPAQQKGSGLGSSTFGFQCRGFGMRAL